MRMTMANNIKSTLPTSENAKEFLKSVEDKFKTVDKSLVGTLMARLTTMKFDGSRGMYEHVIGMTNIAAQLKKLEMTVDDSFLVQFILNSLPPQYGPFQINCNTMKDKWQVSELSSMLIQEETKLKHMGHQSVHSTIQEPLKKRGFKPKKFKKAKAKSYEPITSSQTNEKGKAGGVRCHFCKK